MADQPVLYTDPSQPLAARVADLIGRLTLDEKAAQMLHQAPGVERLGIPAYNWWNECLHGVGRAGRATVFPQAVGLAATFDPERMHQVATAISDEARAKYEQSRRVAEGRWYFGLTYWSPNINIFRDPRWGRGQETYGEDPFLTSRMGVAFVKGLQGDHPTYRKLDATAKHYAVHSGPEGDRHHFDAVVNQRDLRETYLRAFKACVEEAGVASIMGAYNRINGEPCCASPTLLQSILRDEWGFDGYVVSDCGAICDIHKHHKLVPGPAEAAALAVKNGCELNCGQTYAALLTAVDQGLLAEEDLDTALTRLFTARFKLGMFDPDDRNPYAGTDPEVVTCQAHRKLARTMAAESMVLLKNDQDVLPLDPRIGSIAVVGPSAADIGVLLGNYNGFSGTLATPLEGIVDAVSAGTRVSFSQGCDAGGDRPVRTGDVHRALRDADAVVAVLGYNPSQEGEEGTAADSDGGGDRRRIGLPGRQQELLETLCETGKPVILVVSGGSPVDLSWAVDHVAALVMMWYPGEQGGHALADVLFGKTSPSGRLPLTFVKSLAQLPPFDEYAMAGRTYRFMADEPLFPFGYGLSYSRFHYADMDLEPERIAPDASTRVRVRVTNVGERPAREVAQLYVTDVQASVPVPLRHLEGLASAELDPGESTTLSFQLGPENLCCYDDDGLPMVEPGTFRLVISGTQPDVCQGLPRRSNQVERVLTVE